MKCRACKNDLSFKRDMDIYICKNCGNVYVINLLFKNNEFENFMENLKRTNSKKNSIRKKFLLYWYTRKELKKYWQLLSDSNWNGLRKHHSKKCEGDCPVCQILEIKSKIDENKISGGLNGISDIGTEK